MSVTAIFHCHRINLTPPSWFDICEELKVSFLFRCRDLTRCIFTLASGDSSVPPLFLTTRNPNQSAEIDNNFIILEYVRAPHWCVVRKNA